MRRRIFIALLGWIAATRLPPAPAQPAAKIPRIGYLATDLAKASHEAFVQGLLALGYVNGRNVLIEYRYGEGQNFAHEVFRFRDRECVIIRGDEEIALLRYLQLAQKRARAVVLQGDFNAELLPKFLRDFLNRLFQIGGAENRERFCGSLPLRTRGDVCQQDCRDNESENKSHGFLGSIRTASGCAAD